MAAAPARFQMMYTFPSMPPKIKPDGMFNTGLVLNRALAAADTTWRNRMITCTHYRYDNDGYCILGTFGATKPADATILFSAQAQWEVFPGCPLQFCR